MKKLLLIPLLVITSCSNANSSLLIDSNSLSSSHNLKAESPPFKVKVVTNVINPKTGRPYRIVLDGIRDNSEKCVNGFQEARAYINGKHSDGYSDADICGRMSFRVDANNVVRVDLVNYKPGFTPRPTPTPTPKPTPTPRPTPTPSPTPRPTPTPSPVRCPKYCPAGTKCVQFDCDVFGQCQCK